MLQPYFLLRSFPRKRESRTPQGPYFVTLDPRLRGDERVCVPSPAVEKIIDPLRERLRDALDRGEVFGLGARDRFGGTEMVQ